MQTYSEDTLVKDVRVTIDENTSVAAFTDSDGGAFDADTLEMEEIIKSKIPDAINAVRMAAPLRFLEPEKTQPTVAWDDEDKGLGHVTLPSGFMRLAYFKMSDWQYGVSAADSPSLYRQMYSEYMGVRGNPLRPSVFITEGGDDGRAALRFFSCDSAEATAEMLHVGCVTDAASSYQIEEAVYRAVVLKTAALVMANYSNADLMRLLESLCEEQLRVSD